MECRAPDLSDIAAPVVATYLLSATFHGGLPDNYQLRSYLTNFIRSSDRAIEEYSEGRRLLIEYAASHNRTLLLLRAMSRLETAIHYLRRAHRFFDRLRVHPEGPTIDRVPRRLFDSYANRIIPLRDAIEHIDERVGKGEIVEGQPIALAITADGNDLQIAEFSLSLSDLANALRHLHGFASALAHPSSAFPAPSA